MVRSAVSLLAWACAALVGPVVAQFPPSPQHITIVKSKLNPAVSISYKEVSSLLTASHDLIDHSLT
jgi:hypothetical protein